MTADARRERIREARRPLGLEHPGVQLLGGLTDDQDEGEDPDQFLLIETSDAGHYLTTWPTPAEASAYHLDQEGDDWTVVALIDLDTGDRYRAELTMHFVPDTPTPDHPPTT